MQTLDLKRIMHTHGLKPVSLSRDLFPNHKRPYHALRYVLQGKGFLTSEQLAKLSEIVGLPVGSLFTGSWSAKTLNSKVVQFVLLGTMVELNLETRVSMVYTPKSQSPVELTHEKGVTLSAYLEKLTNFINTIN